MIPSENDYRIRREVFAWLERLAGPQGEVLSRTVLEQGVPYQGNTIHVIGAKGIFKPKQLDIPISITTAPDGPYNDRVDLQEAFLLYKYRGTDAAHSDNEGLRRAYSLGIPLVYFLGLVPGRYLPVWPVFVVGDDPASLTFRISVDAGDIVGSKSATFIAVAESGAERRAYITANVKIRLHQQSFRERVLRAYRDQCAVCRLRHRELLDAAHIIADAEPAGDPVVANGLSLCKLHHAAFDRDLIGVRPDYVVEVSEALLKEKDGPMLEHGLQGVHHKTLWVPKVSDACPDPHRLARRYQRFRGGASF